MKDVLDFSDVIQGNKGKESHEVNGNEVRERRGKKRKRKKK